MRWIRFEREGGACYGIVNDNTVEEVAGSPFGEHGKTGKRFALEEVKLLAPVIPPTFYAAGLNYEEHIRSVAAAAGTDPRLPEKPDVGYRAVNALIAHDEPIIIPRDAGEKVHYEAELVAVIGKQAKHLSEEQALSCVFGYTIGNDVSERGWQASDRTLWRAKNTDTWKPMGPWIETDVDLDALRTTVRVNGETTIEFSTNNMLFGVARFISAMTRYLTLYPGDILWMGTEGASPDMKAGDVCEIEISGIGTLKNTFQAEA
ncbi:MAG: fumarylacetoacetate hydrolase family protein [SAR324 cluster bacterium]|nr:fumarylacetoacetate hydrolase family protein [SAR324 cluster bacterium]